MFFWKNEQMNIEKCSPKCSEWLSLGLVIKGILFSFLLHFVRILLQWAYILFIRKKILIIFETTSTLASYLWPRSTPVWLNSEQSSCFAIVNPYLGRKIRMIAERYVGSWRAGGRKSELGGEDWQEPQGRKTCALQERKEQSWVLQSRAA